ncbi:hypothetical protein BAU15_05320 [Enterococcus sp. JM4C]|uniref:hypothetical protein n=1 Tax=Candidatus Enterococcus huntleyi TaxID=1857217 RepID=UPI001379DB57|nr:hypothetical protein [Enterococcus sp. JM4C]KAF1295173.1 hypothetical protein BAU15_05320 [Enterococcus sp. JM4C]
MKVFYEAKVEIVVADGFVDVYKKAIELENERYFINNPIFNSDNQLVSDSVKSVWSGNTVSIIKNIDDSLTIFIISRTLQNLEVAVKSFESMGGTAVYTNYREDRQ